MKKVIHFNSPFWQYGGLGFFNCYAVVYLYLQGVSNKSVVCSAKEGIGCNNCNNCSNVLNNLFATIQG